MPVQILVELTRWGPTAGQRQERFALPIRECFGVRPHQQLVQPPGHLKEHLLMQLRRDSLWRLAEDGAEEVVHGLWDVLDPLQRTCHPVIRRWLTIRCHTVPPLCLVTDR